MGKVFWHWLLVMPLSMSLCTQGTLSQRHIGQAVSQSSEAEPDASPVKTGRRRGRKKMPSRRGRKPLAKSPPVTDLDKKKAWSILPRRPIVDPQEEEEEKDGDDEGKGESMNFND